MSHQKTTPGTLLYRIVQMGHSPLLCAFTKVPKTVPSYEDMDNGIVDTMRYLICHDNFIKPYSSEHIILSLLTKAF